MYIQFYNVNPKFKKLDQPSYWPSHYEFYILPMLRYLHRDKILQFRWIVWGINIKLT